MSQKSVVRKNTGIKYRTERRPESPAGSLAGVVDAPDA